MRILAVVMLSPCLLASVGASAQQRFADGDIGSPWKIPAEAEPRLSGSGVALPVIDYTGPDGSLKVRRGIVAGMEVAPNATVGVGLFESMPKKQPSHWQSDNPMARTQKRSRKAAVGLTFRF